MDLPGFTRSKKRGADVAIRSGPVVSRKTHSNSIFSINKLPDGLVIDWFGVASYRITGGQDIVITPEFDADSVSQLTTQPLYGIAIAAILHQRHHTILHGSTVEINGKSLVLLGQKGQGKSTLTAALLSRGHGFISDDVTALQIQNSHPIQVLPGIPCLRLRADAARATGHNPDKLPFASPLIPKHILSVQDQFKNIAFPLNTIVSLEHGDTITLQEMNESEKMLCLLGGQYFAKYYDALQDSDHKRLFQHYSTLAKSTRIARLTTPRDLHLLPDTAKLLEQYVATN